MSDQKPKEQRFEELAQAVAGGEVTMVKYLWELLERIESVVEETPQQKVNRMKKEVDVLLKRLNDDPPKDGERGAQGPAGKDGKDGKPGRDGRDGRDGDDGRDGRDGEDGKDGETGGIPDHQWRGTKIRFEKDDGSWGEWVDLRGPQGATGQSHGPSDGGYGGPMEIPIKAGTNVTVRKDASGAYVISATGGGGGSGVTVETPAGTVNSVNTVFTPTSEPKWVVADGVTYFAGAGYTWNGSTITMDLAPSQFIRDII